MKDIDFRLLQAAIAVAEELNLSRAAERLEITQPALTKRLHDLEKRLGVLLFERTSRGVVLTEACRGFIEDARLAPMYLERAVQRTRVLAKSAEAVLHLGRSPYTDPYIVSLFSTTRLPLYPSRRVELTSNFSAELAREGLSGELDLALIAEGIQSSLLNYLVVQTKPFFILLRESDPISAHEGLTLEHLHEQPWVLFARHVHPVLYDRVLQIANNRKVRPADVQTIQTAEEAASLVAQRGGAAFLTQTGAWRVMEPGLTIRPLQEEDLYLRTALISRAGESSRLISEFMRASMRRLERVTSTQLSLEIVSR